MQALRSAVLVNRLPGRGQRLDQCADVSDLVALAVALDCAPSRLFLSDQPDDSGQLQLTAQRATSWPRAWQWAAGERTLGDGGPASVDAQGRHVYKFDRLLEAAEWRAKHRPDNQAARLTADDVMRVRDEQLADVVREIKSARDRGVPATLIFGYIDILRAVIVEPDRTSRSNADGR